KGFHSRGDVGVEFPCINTTKHRAEQYCLCALFLEGNYKRLKSLYIKLGCLWQRLFLICGKCPAQTTPFPPLLRGNSSSPPYQRGIQGVVWYATNFEFPIHLN
ncbi:MAG: hypothetical protein AAB013_00310, partial [Planctomycetota bacterium]